MLGGRHETGWFFGGGGLIALHEMPKHLATDHANAKVSLPGSWNQIEGFEVEMNHVDIDMVFFTTTLPETVLDRFLRRLQKITSMPR